LQERLAQVPGIRDVRDNLREGPLQVRIVPQEPACSEFALTPYDVAMAVRAASAGAPAGSLRHEERQEELPIRVQLCRHDRASLEELLSLQVRTPLGATPRLEELAEPFYEQGVASLYRYNGLRVITVSASMQSTLGKQGESVGIRRVNEIVQEQFELLKEDLPGLTLSLGGGYSSQQDTAGRMVLSGLAAGALIYLILLVQFRSYVLPFLVLLTLVFAFVGVVGGLCVHGYAVSVVTAVSLVGLFGVAVNDAILYIDFINQAPRQEGDRFAHLLEGGRLRLRPIILTTVTTVVGLVPMATGLCGYSSIWSPFAVCFCYGLTAATLMTLVFIPCFYAMYEDVVRFIGTYIPLQED
jgi:HAE1 family hydrophobic/amphiphilic exporter-1